jgi:hypothetical protein
MIDAYGIEIEDVDVQRRRLASAREGYEAACRRRGVSPDWDGLDSDERHLWFMTADALMKHRAKRETAIAC